MGPQQSGDTCHGLLILSFSNQTLVCAALNSKWMSSANSPSAGAAEEGLRLRGHVMASEEGSSWGWAGVRGRASERSVFTYLVPG